VPERIVSEAMLAAARKAFLEWVWQAFRSRDRSVEHVASAIALTRQGFARLLRRQGKRVFFDTFLSTCFLRLERECGFTIAVEGWQIELRWRVERRNGSCVSPPPERR
jgi:hypothetical protein